MTRKEARECFMQLLYQMDVQQEFGRDIKDRFFMEYIVDDSQRDYLEGLYTIICEKLPEIDKVLAASSEHWKFEWIAKVDLAVLRLSVAEIFYFKEIPISASINEAVLLGKKFGGEDSGKFINGILGKIAKDKDGQDKNDDPGV